MTLRLLDCFSGAGGAGMGYARAGFEVVGVDIEPQPHYPFEFHHADALDYIAQHGHEFDAIHASPPCQAYTRARAITDKYHPKLISMVRELLQQTGKPYIIENVPGAPVRVDLLLCGSMFGLGYGGLTLYRHRWFEGGGAGFRLSPLSAAVCNHSRGSVSVFGGKVLGGPKNGITYHHPNERKGLGVEAGRAAMGCDWMTLDELSEAIPPAYTEFIGRQLIAVLEAA